MANHDDPDDEMRGNSAIAKARRRERDRCAAIMGCEAAADDLQLAAHLAFNTRLTRHEAIARLEAAAAKFQGWDLAFARARGNGGAPAATSLDAAFKKVVRARARH